MYYEMSINILHVYSCKCVIILYLYACIRVYEKAESNLTFFPSLLHFCYC